MSHLQWVKNQAKRPTTINSALNYVMNIRKKAEITLDSEQIYRLNEVCTCYYFLVV